MVNGGPFFHRLPPKMREKTRRTTTTPAATATPFLKSSDIPSNIESPLPEQKVIANDDYHDNDYGRCEGGLVNVWNHLRNPFQGVQGYVWENFVNRAPS